MAAADASETPEALRAMAVAARAASRALQVLKNHAHRLAHIPRTVADKHTLCTYAGAVQ
jgi:hypothetical protein